MVPDDAQATWGSVDIFSQVRFYFLHVYFQARSFHVQEYSTILGRSRCQRRWRRKRGSPMFLAFHALVAVSRLGLHLRFPASAPRLLCTGVLARIRARGGTGGGGGGFRRCAAGAPRPAGGAARGGGRRLCLSDCRPQLCAAPEVSSQKFQ